MRDGPTLLSDVNIIVNDTEHPQHLDLIPRIGPAKGLTTEGLYRLDSRTQELWVLTQGPDLPRPTRLADKAAHQPGLMIFKQQA